MAGGKWYEALKQSVPATPTTPEAAAPVTAAPRPVAVKPPTVKPTVVPTASTPVAAPAKKRKQQFEELPEGGFAAVLRGPEEVEQPTPAPIVAPVKVPQAQPFDAYKAGVLPPGSPAIKEGEAVSNPQYARATELYKRRKEIESTLGLPPEKAIEYLTTELVDKKAPELRLGQYTDPASRAANMVEAKEFLRQQEVYRQKMDSTAARMPYWNEAQQIADAVMISGRPAQKLTLDFYERFTDYQMKQSGADQLRLKNEDEYQAQRRLAQQNARRAIEWLQASGNPFATSDITPVTVKSIKEAKAEKGTLGAVAETARVLAPKRSVTVAGDVVRAESLPSYLFDMVFNAGGMGVDLLTSTTGVDPMKPVWEAKNLKEAALNTLPVVSAALGVAGADKRSGEEVAQDVLDTLQYRRSPSMRYSENPEVAAALQSENPEVWVPAWAGYFTRMGAEMLIPGAEEKAFAALGKTMTASKDFYKFGRKSIDDITAIKTSNIPKDQQFAAIKDAVTLNAQEYIPNVAPKLDVPVDEVRARIVADRIRNIADQGDVAGAFAAADGMTPEYKTKYADVLFANFSDLEGGDNLLEQAGIIKSEGVVVLTDPARVDGIATKLDDKVADLTPKLERANDVVKVAQDELRKTDEAIRAYTDAGSRPPDSLLAQRKSLTESLAEKSKARGEIRTNLEDATRARESLDDVEQMLREAHKKAAETLLEASGGPARVATPLPPLRPRPKDIEKAVEDALGTLVSDATAGRLQNVEDLKGLLTTLKREGADALTQKYIDDVLSVARQRTPAVDALLRRMDDAGITNPIDRMRAILNLDPERELGRAATAAKRMTDADISRLKAEEAAAELLAQTEQTKDVAEKLKPVNAQMRQKMGKRLAVQQAIAKAEAAKGATTAEEVGAAVADDVVGAPAVEAADEAAAVADAPAEAPVSPQMAENNAANSMGDADVAETQAQATDLSQALDAQTRVRMGLSPYPVVAKQQVQRFGSLPRSYSRGLSNEPFLRPDLVFTNKGRIPASELPPSAAEHLFKLANDRAYNNIWSYAMGTDDVALSIQKAYVDAAEQIPGLTDIAEALKAHPAAADRAARAAQQFSKRVGVPYVPKRVTQRQFRDGMKKYFDALDKARDPAKPTARGMNEYYRSLLQRSNPDKTLPVDAIHYNDFVVVHSADAADKAGPLSRYVQYIDDSSGLEVSKTGTVKTVGPDFVGRVVGERVAGDGSVKILIEPHEFLRGDARYTKAAVEPVEVDPEVLGYYERGRTTDLFVGRGVASKDAPLGRKFGINKSSPRPLLEEEWAEVNKAHKGSKALGKVKYNQTSGMSKLDNYFDELGPPERPTMDAFTISADDLAALPENIREPVKRALSKPEFFLEEGVEAAAKKVEAPRAPAPEPISVKTEDVLAPHKNSTFESGTAAKNAAEKNRSITNSGDFIRWFAGSKIVDASGSPVIVYRGGTPVDVIRTDIGGGTTQLGRGAYFGEVGLAEEFASFRPDGKVGAYYLSMKNPFDETGASAMEPGVFADFKRRMQALGVPAKSLKEMDSPYAGIITDLSKDLAKARGVKGSDAAWVVADDINSVLRDMGFDGIIADWNRGSVQYVAFSSDQIRSATRLVKPDELLVAAPTKLPAELAGAKPRFNIGKASYSPQFESDIDKALYIVAQTKQSARHDDYLQFLRDATGMTDDEINVAAGKVRAELKTTLKGKPEGAVDIPTIWKAEAPKATPEEVAKAKPVQKLRVEPGEVPEPPKGDAELDALRAEEQRLTSDIEALKAESEALRAEATGRATAGGIADLEKKLAELNDRAVKAGARLAEAQATAADAKAIAESAAGVREVLEESFAEVRKAKEGVLGDVRAEQVGKELRFRQAIAERERLAAMQPGERLADLQRELGGISKAQTAAYRQGMDNWFGSIARGARGIDRFVRMLGTDTIEATEELLGADYRDINRTMEVMSKEADLEIDKKLSMDLEALGGKGGTDTSLTNVLSLTEERGYGDTWRMSSGSGSILEGTMDRVAAAYLDYESVDKIAEGNLKILRDIVMNHEGSLPELSDKLYAASKELVGVKMTARGAGDVIFTQNITRQAAVSDAFSSLYGLGGILGPEDNEAVKQYLAGTKLSDRGRAIALTYMKKLVGDNVLITKAGDFTQYIDPQQENLFTQVGLAPRKIDTAIDNVDKMFATDIYIPAPIRRKMSDIMTAPQNFTRRDWRSSVISIWKQGTLFGSGFGPTRAEFFTDNLFQTMDAIGVQQGLAQGIRAVTANSLKTVLMTRVGPMTTSFVDTVRFIAGNKAIRPGQTSREAMEQVSRFEEVLAGGHIGTETTAVLNAEDTVIDGFGGMTGRDLWRIATKNGVGEGVGTDLLVRQLEDALRTGPVGRLSALMGEGLTRSAGYIEQRKRFGLFMTRTQMLIDEAGAVDAATIRKLADQAARETTEAMLNYEIALHPFERSFFVQLALPFLAFEKSNTTRVAKQITSDSTVTAFAARLGKLYRGKTAVVQGWSKWADPSDEYGFDVESMKIDDEQREEGKKLYPQYVAATEALRANGVTPGFVRYQWADTKNGAEFDALAEFSTYYAAPPPGLVVPDYAQKKFSAVWNAGRLNSLDAYQGAMNPKSKVDRSTNATFTTLWADGNLDAFNRPIALAEFLGLIGMKMAGTVDPQVGQKIYEAAGRVGINPLETQVGGAIVDVFSPLTEKPTSFTQPLKLSETAGSVLAKLPFSTVVKVSNGQFVNDEGTLEMEDGYYLPGTTNAMATLAPLVLGRFGAGFPRAVFAGKEWSAFDDKFIDQMFGNPNNPKQARKIALDYMVGLRSGNIDIRKQEKQLTKKYLGELTKPFPGGEAARTVENVTAFGQQAASTTRAPEKTDKEITEAVVVATSGKDRGLAGDTALRAFLIQQGGDAEAIKSMDTDDVYDAVANLPAARKAAREAAASAFGTPDAAATKAMVEVYKRKATSMTWSPDSIAIMRFALSTPMPGNNYARYTPEQVDQMTADEVRKELMK
jgi:hypothetical protein